MSELDIASQKPGWERAALEKLAFSNIKEQRAARRWSIFFKLAWLALALFLVFRTWMPGISSGAKSNVGGAHTAVVSLKGVIDSEGHGSADAVIRSLRAAFENNSSKGVILAINSPGGSPVQSGMIFSEIKRLRVKYPDKKLVAVVEEICASGGYYVASAADQIYADQASLVGSIGVLMDGFGFTGLMDKVGVERRLYTAGENKGFLDPFSTMNDKQRAHIQTMLTDIHQQFISAVKVGRGKALKDNPEIFSGLVWTGKKAVDLGLIDGLSTIEAVARDQFKAEELVDYTIEENIADRLAKRLGASFGASFGASLNATVAKFLTSQTGVLK